MRTILNVSICLAAAVATTGCLKTRAQLRQDGSDTGDGPSAPSRPVPAQVEDVQPQGSYAIDEIKGEITRLQGRLEDLEHHNSETSKSAANANKDDVKRLEARIVELEQAQVSMLEAIKKFQGSVPPPDATDVYEKGRAEITGGNLSAAIESFTEYLKNPKGKLAEEATFLRGEAYYSLKNYRKAINDYSRFPEKFTTSKHMPQALYKIGLCFESMGMKEDAKAFFQELVEKYPKTAEAKKAKAKSK